MLITNSGVLLEKWEQNANLVVLLFLKKLNTKLKILLMRKFTIIGTFLLFVFAVSISSVMAQNAWINELHYDNASTDVDEMIEVVIENPGSYALSDFAVYLYNGSNGTTYGNEIVSNFTVGATVGDFTIYTWLPSSIQNGAPDGLALVYQGAVVTDQFLSYEGSLTATDGPANGLTSTDIGVSETSSTPAGESLQLSGAGSAYTDFIWENPAPETAGLENNSQTLGGTPPPPPTSTELYYEPFETNLGQTTQFSSVGAQEWTWGNYGLPPGCSVMNGYSGGAQDNEDWLITNSIDCSNYTNIMLSFDHARNYGDNSGLSVLVSTDYDGTSDPTGFTWVDVTSNYTFPDPGSWSFIDAGSFDITANTGATTYVAFKYTSNTTSAATWEVDNIKVEADLDITAFVAGSFNGWNASDPAYEMLVNSNDVFELTKNLGAGTHEYKVVENGSWYPNDNQIINLAAAEDVTWKYSYHSDFVIHTNPIVAGDFLSALGGANWDPTELLGEMSDTDNDEIYTLEVVIPVAGSYECKVTLNESWTQNTGGNVGFTSDGVTATIFTYDFVNNVTTVSGPPPPSAIITFIVDDSQGQNYDGYNLKGSWSATGNYDPGWNNGNEHSAFYDDGTNGDVTPDDHIWTCQQELVSDGGSNTWEWGVNDTEHNWIAGNWQFNVVDGTPQTLTWTIPVVPNLFINEIMYNSIAGPDEEWIELYNGTDASIDLENWNICDSDASHSHIIIPAGYSVGPGEYFTISIVTNGAFPFTPDYDGTGNFALNNSGDNVRIWNPDFILVDAVEFTDAAPWPTEPDGDGPSLSLLDLDLDNSIPENWAGSNQLDGSPGAFNFPINILTPNGGEVIEIYSTYDITWTIEEWTGNVDIELIRDGQDPTLIVSNLDGSLGSFSWYVFDNIPIGSDYKIQITDVADPNILDRSDDYFTIEAGYLAPELVITEIMYNPPESGNDSLEFIEIYNNGDATVNLDGFTFTSGIEFVFPAVDLNPDEYVLVGINSAAMLSTYGVDAYQWTGGALSNSGELVELSDGIGVVDAVDYSDQLPWDTLADGYGPSLTLCNPDADNAIPENWTHSVNLAAINADGDSIWATPGFGCQVTLLAGFLADVTFVQAGETVLFTDQTVGDPIEWTWTFEGGTPGTFTGQTPPAIQYDELGTWDVTLYVSDGTNSDEVTYTDYIEVVDFPAPTNLVATVGPMDDVQLTWNAPMASGFADDFESYDDFSIEFLPWTNLDVDGSTTYGMTDITWPNAYDPQAFIIFNPAQTTPPVDDIVPHSGDKLAACFASTAPPNNDWMITPMVNIAAGSNVSFWAKSYTDAYGLERFRVGVSTTGMDPADFTIVSPGDYVEAPVDDWTEFSYDLNAYAGQNVYVGIQCVSNDAFILLVDDITIAPSKSSFAFNTTSPVNGRKTKDVSYSAKPATTFVVPVVENRNVTADLLGYNVYRDDMQINAAMVEVTEYNDPEPTIGSHDYFVTAVYDGGESVPSNVVTVLVTGMDELSENSVSVYPNPTTGKFTIAFNSELSAEVVLMDITGKEVYNETINGSSQIDVTGLQKGIYLVRILDTTSNNIIIKKLIVR